MSEKPSYLGMLNAIAVGESQAHCYLTAWIDKTDDPGVKNTLSTVATREGEHGMSFAKRINELGYSVRRNDDEDAAFQKRLAIAASDRSDLEKMEKLGLGRLDTGDKPDIFDRMFNDHSIDIATGTLLGRYIAEERDSGRLLKCCYDELKSRGTPSHAPDDDRLAALEAKLDAVCSAVGELQSTIAAAANGNGANASQNQALTAHHDSEVSEDIPLLEFDPDPVGVVDPSVSHARFRDTIPERAVLCFYAEILAALPEEADQIGVLEAAHGLHPIWRIRRHGEDVAVFHPGVGAPLAAGFLEEAIVMGARKVVACGGCGTLTSEVGAGDIVVPTAAVRDEGTSFHYLPPSRLVEADPVGVAAAIELLTERGVPHVAGKVWTTDGLYRETRQRVETRRAEGCLVVEMEAAAFFAVARFRGIRFAQLLYGGDDLSGPEWDAREWTVSPSRVRTFDLAVELACRL